MGKHILFKNLNTFQNVPYTKVDIMKCAALNDSVGMNFFQFDYIATASDSGVIDSEEEVALDSILVERIVMDYSSFCQMRNEVNDLFEKMQKRRALLTPDEDELENRSDD